MMSSPSLNNFQPNSYTNATYNYNQEKPNSMLQNHVPLIPSSNMANVNSGPLASNFNTNPVALLNPSTQMSAPPPYTSNQGLSSQPPVEVAQPALNTYSTNAAAGWNDPPVLNKAPKVQVCPCKFIFISNNIYLIIYILR